MNSVELNYWPSSVPRILWRRRNCPRCSSIEFQTADSHSLDRLLGLLALSPIRCVNGDGTIGLVREEQIKHDGCRNDMERSHDASGPK